MTRDQFMTERKDALIRQLQEAVADANGDLDDAVMNVCLVATFYCHRLAAMEWDTKHANA